MQSESKTAPVSLERGMEVEGGRREVVAVANKQSIRWADFLLRLLAFVLTLVAAIVLGVDKQTTVVTTQIVPTLPPVSVPLTAKSHHLSAFVYFVVVNAIACAYAVVSMVFTLANRGKYNGMSLMIIILDLIAVALLFSGGGAAAAIGLMGYKGNTHVRWNKVCNVFERFCGQVAAAVGISLVASVLFLLLILFAALNLHKKHH
ncbi:CASP-like protein 1E2 [Ipomoea triloba]|uniref:CASP-like protein 1E2 n=1 Tax=Ipomoea triloba TaxID=35885 RepID=UPI00125E59C3|nr:CASP-like protein 1E2 [Ipomoea triloba]